MWKRAVCRLFGLSLLAATLQGCDPSSVSTWFMPKEETQIAQSILDQLRTRDFAAIEEKLDPKFRTPEVRTQLEQAANALAGERVDQRVAVNAAVLTTTTFKRHSINFHTSVESGSAIAEVAFERSDAGIKIVHLVVRPIPAAVEQMNAFTLSGKGWTHYLMLLCMTAVPIFIVATVVLCVRTPIRRRKWLWVLFILLGFGHLSMNWTTGEIAIAPLTVNLLGAGFSRQLDFAPWIMQVSFPLGAIIFLLRRKRLAKLATVS